MIGLGDPGAYTTDTGRLSSCLMESKNESRGQQRVSKAIEVIKQRYRESSQKWEGSLPLKACSESLLLRTDWEACGLEILVLSWFEQRPLITPFMTYFFEVWYFLWLQCSHQRKTLPNSQGRMAWSIPLSHVCSVLVLLPAGNNSFGA